MHRKNFVHTRIHPASIRGLTKRRVVLSRFTYIQEYKGPGSVQSFPIRKSTEIHYFSPERFRQITDKDCLSEAVPGLKYSGTSRIPPEVGPWRWQTGRRLGVRCHGNHSTSVSFVM